MWVAVPDAAGPAPGGGACRLEPPGVTADALGRIYWPDEGLAAVRVGMAAVGAAVVFVEQLRVARPLVG